jgi:hypothetical protein
VIGPGSLPKPFARFKRRTLAYTRRRRHNHARGKNRPPIREAVHHDSVIFERFHAELPVATLVAHDARSRSRALLGGLATWLLARWQWLRPRTVPVIASAIGALLVIAAADYLTRAHGAPIYPHHGHVHVAYIAPR